MINHLKTTTCALTLGLLTALSSTQLFANQAKHIEVSDPFTREMPPGSPATASFMTLKNSSDHDIKLVKASTQISKKAELHTHTNDNGMMQMREVPFFEIPAHGQTQLQPGGNHIMLISPIQPIQAGKTVSVMLTFEDGSSKNITMPVKSVMNTGMKNGNHNNHSHHHH